MSILEEILAHKRTEVAARKKQLSVSILEQSRWYQREPVSLSASLKAMGSTGIIAEIKRKSPSKGIIHAGVSVEAIATGYERAGASGLSILTDTKFFGGSNEDLETGRNAVACPILRKDFIIDEYQIIEARSIGADVILLIAAALEPAQIQAFCSLAHGLDMEVLLEVHNEKELRDNLKAGADLVGVNNRDLRTFSVSVDVSKKLSMKIPDDVVKISESGIDSPQAIRELRDYGFRGFLIGQTFMEQTDPGAGALNFINQLKAKSIVNG